MERPVVPLSRYARDHGAVLGSVIGRLVPMAAWVAFGPWLGFVRGPFRLRKPLPPLVWGWDWLECVCVGWGGLAEVEPFAANPWLAVPRARRKTDASTGLREGGLSCCQPAIACSWACLSAPRRHPRRMRCAWEASAA